MQSGKVVTIFIQVSRWCKCDKCAGILKTNKNVETKLEPWPGQVTTVSQQSGPYRIISLGMRVETEVVSINLYYAKIQFFNLPHPPKMFSAQPFFYDSEVKLFLYCFSSIPPFQIPPSTFSLHNIELWVWPPPIMCCHGPDLVTGGASQPQNSFDRNVTFVTTNGLKCWTKSYFMDNLGKTFNLNNFKTWERYWLQFSCSPNYQF